MSFLLQLHARTQIYKQIYRLFGLAMSAKKILLVFGATGRQGGSVINSILSDDKASQLFKIRGVTRGASCSSIPSHDLSDIRADRSHRTPNYTQTLLNPLQKL